MPQRILRDWTKSEKVDRLSPNAEVFFTRLIMRVDDFGRCLASSKVLRADLFPLKEINLTEVESWLAECTKAGLICVYTVNGKSYLEIFNFNQRLRIKRKLHPDPVHAGHMSDMCQSSVGHMSADGGHMSDTCLSHDGHMSDTCQSYVSHMSDICPPEVEDEAEVEDEVEALECAFFDQSECLTVEARTPATPAVVPTAPAKRPTEAANEDFEAFWKAYPRKTAKAEARKAWEQKKEVIPPLDELVAHIQRLQGGRSWVEGFIPHAATWLRGERWNDEAEPPRPRLGKSGQPIGGLPIPGQIDEPLPF